MPKRPVLQTRKLEYDTENILKFKIEFMRNSGGKLGYDKPVYLTST